MDFVDLVVAIKFSERNNDNVETLITFTIFRWIKQDKAIYENRIERSSRDQRLKSLFVRVVRFVGEMK